jgi:ABC-2 type transport system ATP-binding protein
MALTADHLIVIGRGRLIADSSVEEVIDAGSRQSVLVRSRDDAALAARLEALGAGVVPAPAGGLLVSGTGPGAVGEAALAAAIVLEELTPQRVSLEEAFMELTRGEVEFAAGGLAGTAPSALPEAASPLEPRQ